MGESMISRFFKAMGECLGCTDPDDQSYVQMNDLEKLTQGYSIDDYLGVAAIDKDLKGMQSKSGKSRLFDVSKYFYRFSHKHANFLSSKPIESLEFEALFTILVNYDAQRDASGADYLQPDRNANENPIHNMIDALARRTLVTMNTACKFDLQSLSNILKESKYLKNYKCIQDLAKKFDQRIKELQSLAVVNKLAFSRK